jgi:hypothetical protein
MQFRNSAGEKITVAQAAFAFTVQMAVGFALLACLYGFTVVMFSL